METVSLRARAMLSASRALRRPSRLRNSAACSDARSMSALRHSPALFAWVNLASSSRIGDRIATPPGWTKHRPCVPGGAVTNRTKSASRIVAIDLQRGAAYDDSNERLNRTFPHGGPFDGD